MILTRISAALALGGFILIAAATLKYAQAENAISPEITKRSMQVLFGLMLAAYANVMPKDIGNWQASSRAAARSQSALRVGGWSLTLAGLAYAGLWAFAAGGGRHRGHGDRRLRAPHHDGLWRADPDGLPIRKTSRSQLGRTAMRTQPAPGLETAVAWSNTSFDH